MGLKPGETDCSVCVKRPLAEGGSGACPFRGVVLELYQKGKWTCPKFREGDYVTKRQRIETELNPQEEALF